jgi:glycerol kinase
VKALRVDGGAAANNFLMQYQADLLGTPVVRPKVVETTALGAGLLAGMGVGLWRSQRDLERGRRVDRVFEPRQGRAWRDAEYGRWKRAVAQLLSTR